MAWIRLEAAFFSHHQCIEAGWDGTMVFLAALTMCKLRGWRKGRIPKGALRPTHVAHHLCSDGRIDVEAGLRAAIGAELLTEYDEDYFLVAAWAKFQIDPTNAERQARHRAKGVTEVTVSNGDKRSVTEVTGTVSRTSRPVRPVRSGPSGTEKTPLPPPEGGQDEVPPPQAKAAQRRLRPRQFDAVGVILDQLCRGAVTQAHQAQALKDRKLYRSGDLPMEVAVHYYDRFHEQFAKSIRSARDLNRRERENKGGDSPYAARAAAEAAARRDA